MIKDSQKIQVYFYNGFQAPKLIAKNLKELKAVTLSDTYRGDVTEELLEVIEDCGNVDDLREELAYFDMYVNPTKRDFIEANKSYFDCDSLETYLNEWESMGV